MMLGLVSVVVESESLVLYFFEKVLPKQIVSKKRDRARRKEGGIVIFLIMTRWNASMRSENYKKNEVGQLKQETKCDTYNKNNNSIESAIGCKT